MEREPLASARDTARTGPLPYLWAWRVRQRADWETVVLAAVVAGILLGLASFMESLGVGHFGQDVVVDTDMPIRRVAFAPSSLDDESRHRVENEPSTKYFVTTDAHPIGGNRFSTQLTFTTRESWYRSQVFYPPHLVVYVEFEDGTLHCRVADVPAGRGKTPIVIRLR